MENPIQEYINQQVCRLHQLDIKPSQQPRLSRLAQPTGLDFVRHLVAVKFMQRQKQAHTPFRIQTESERNSHKISGLIQQ
jgi:hypothetical protein